MVIADRKTAKATLRKQEKRAAAREKRRPRLPNLKERQRFKELILSNPNYFGNLKNSQFKAQLTIQSNTTYEEIGCAG